MTLQRIPAVFMRGGTSKAVIFKQADLPDDPQSRDEIFLKVMGSPDSYGRQLDGMGGGISSLSKVCVVGPPTIEGADVDYTFAQISVRSASVDYSGNCGNMSSAIGPFSIDEKLVSTPPDGDAVVRVHNTNTGKIIHAHFPVRNGLAVVEGDFSIDGVAGRGAAVKLEFRDPGGARTGRLLPTGGALDSLDIDGLGTLEASMIDAANPCVFVAAEALGKRGDENPEVLEADTDFLNAMEKIRCAASIAMGLAPNETQAAAVPSVPKVAMLTSPMDVDTLSGSRLRADDFDIGVRMISIGQPHRAVPITGAVCLGVAVQIAGSLPNKLARLGKEPTRIGHPSGIVVVDAKLRSDSADSELCAEYGAVYRTARRLFEGNVCYSSDRK